MRHLMMHELPHYYIGFRARDFVITRARAIISRPSAIRQMIRVILLDERSIYAIIYYAPITLRVADDCRCMHTIAPRQRFTGRAASRRAGPRVHIFRHDAKGRLQRARFISG